jgi:HEAT repeat protein
MAPAPHQVFLYSVVEVLELTHMPSPKLVGIALAACCLLCLLPPDSSCQVQSPEVRAWSHLEAGVAQKRIVKRAIAVGVLGLIPDDAHALQLAENALKDSKPQVRVAAATALGQMHALAAGPELKQALNDKNLHVVLAAAHALSLINDSSCYEVYYAILTGERKNQESMIDQQLAVLRDPKQLEELGFGEGLGFVPFAGIGWDAMETILRDRKNGAIAKAAIIAAVATDPDPRAADALVAATQHDTWILRVAALQAIAKRGDPSLLPKIEKSIDDPRDEVKYTGTAAVIHLSDVAQSKNATKANLATEPIPQTNP